MCLDVAGQMKEICARAGHSATSSRPRFDKANRSSGTSVRGLGMDEGLEILAEVQRQIGVPVLTDVHDDRRDRRRWLRWSTCCRRRPSCAGRPISSTPCASSGKPVNIKKGQFLAPGDMKNVVDKAREVNGGCRQHHGLRARCLASATTTWFPTCAAWRSCAKPACPVVFDATHSVQLPGGQGTSSGGQREFVPVLARAAVAVGISGLFMETHPCPAKAWSDGPNSWPLQRMESLLATLVATRQGGQGRPVSRN